MTGASAGLGSAVAARSRRPAPTWPATGTRAPRIDCALITKAGRRRLASPATCKTAGPAPGSSEQRSNIRQPRHPRQQRRHHRRAPPSISPRGLGGGHRSQPQRGIRISRRGPTHGREGQRKIVNALPSSLSRRRQRPGLRASKGGVAQLTKLGQRVGVEGSTSTPSRPDISHRQHAALQKDETRNRRYSNASRRALGRAADLAGRPSSSPRRRATTQRALLVVTAAGWALTASNRTT